MAISWITNNMVHTIFGMKYWIISRKINQLVNESSVKFFEIKVRLIFISQIILILTAGFSFIWLAWNSTKKSSNHWEKSILSLLSVLPAFFIVALLANGLFVMKSITINT